MSEAIVEIADVFKDAVKVTAEEINVGDFLFDVFGGTHKVTDRRDYKHRVALLREDGGSVTWERQQIVTIIRGERA
jgi:hypothetical protein